MTSRICTLLLLVTACQFDLKDIGDPTGNTTGEEAGETDGASSEPINATESDPSASGGSGITTAGTSDSSSTSEGPGETGTSSATSPGTSESGSTSMGTATTSEPSTTTGPVETSTTGIPGETEGTEIMCQEGLENFPEFPSECEVEADCAIGYAALDCCTSLKAIGIRAVDEDAFNEAQGICQAQSMVCDCVPLPTIAQDGQSQGQNDTIGVSCQANKCTTFIEP